jgi:4-diphosphocytidyl-2-C-methyl-D-erythritol kinase
VAMSLLILSPAKINLFLKVIRRRPDGYHELFSLMCRVSLCDEILLGSSPGGIAVHCSDPELPTNEDNLAYRAARHFFDAIGRKAECEIELTKRIPVAAGLGGGSSNAASVLLGLNHLHGHPLSRQKLLTIGRSLGADVPFFIFQSPALASGIGDRLEVFEGLASWQVVIVSPPFTVSTRMVYQKLNLRLTKRQKQPTKAHLKKNRFDPSLHLFNDLEVVTLALHPELAGIKASLSTQGALGTLMSGSGPSVFGLFPDARAAQKASAALPHDRGWRLILADMLTSPTGLIREI